MVDNPSKGDGDSNRNGKNDFNKVDIISTTTTSIKPIEEENYSSSTKNFKK